jgi:pimeloyl-ACP methyl ester carboxylesterase
MVVLFDQRGAGRSTPRVSATTDLSANTTDHLIEDVERLREHLGVNRWLVLGNSWGVTLGLAYAERHPTRVSEMVLAAVTMTRPSDIHWLYHEVGRFFPGAWQRFRDGASEANRDGDLVAAYYHLLHEQGASLRDCARQRHIPAPFSPSRRGRGAGADVASDDGGEDVSPAPHAVIVQYGASERRMAAAHAQPSHQEPPARPGRMPATALRHIRNTA